MFPLLSEVVAVAPAWAGHLESVDLCVEDQCTACLQETKIESYKSSRQVLFSDRNTVI